jgi:hypothetical protein
MDSGTFVMSGFGNRDEKLSAIRKIWHTFGRGGFIYAWLPPILTTDELTAANMNRWKNRSLVEHDGWEKIKGKPRRRWKLTSQTIEKCVKAGDDLQNG